MVNLSIDNKQLRSIKEKNKLKFRKKVFKPVEQVLFSKQIEKPSIKLITSHKPKTLVAMNSRIIGWLIISQVIQNIAEVVFVLIGAGLKRDTKISSNIICWKLVTKVLLLLNCT